MGRAIEIVTTRREDATHPIRVWTSGLGVLLALVVLLTPPGPVRRAAAADGSLVIATLHVLEQEYVDTVDPVQLLNAAIAALRDAATLSADQLPDIPAGTSDAAAQDAFIATFAQAVQTGAMSESQFAYAATRGMLASLHDSSTSFLDPSQWGEMRGQLLGAPQSAGIGVTVISRMDPEGVAWIFIGDAFPGSPARNAGLRRFDKILEVDGKPLTNISARDAAQLLRGPAGSTADLLIQRAGQSLKVQVVRDSVRVAPVAAEFLQPGVAYVRIFEFAKGAGQGLRFGFEHVGSDEPIRSIVLDLRGNRGGLVAEAASIGGIFLPQGTVLAMVREKGGQLRVVRASGVPLLAETPLVVLVDSDSASASEMMAAAFKEHQRAFLVGDKTAGVLGGTVALALPEGAIEVTVERILSPYGAQIDGVGITPDVTVALTADDIERGEDTQLQAALRILRAAGRLRMQRCLNPEAVKGMRPCATP